MRTTKKDMIVEALRQRIERGEIQRGTWIRQDTLAEDFNTSITPVREALRELQAEGLLVGFSHRGVQVAEVDLQEVKGIYMRRRLIEPYAMQRAAMRVTRADLLCAEAILDEMEECDPSTDGLRISELNRQFHFLFYDKSGPESFVNGIVDLWDGFPWDLLRVSADRVPRSIAEHREMVAAARDGDLDRLAEVTATHVINGYRTLVAFLVPDDKLQLTTDPFDIMTD